MPKIIDAEIQSGVLNIRIKLIKYPTNSIGDEYVRMVL